MHTFIGHFYLFESVVQDLEPTPQRLLNANLNISLSLLISFLLKRQDKKQKYV